MAKVTRCDRCKKDICGEVALVKIFDNETDYPAQWDLCRVCEDVVRNVLNFKDYTPYG